MYLGKNESVCITTGNIEGIWNFSRIFPNNSFPIFFFMKHIFWENVKLGVLHKSAVWGHVVNFLGWSNNNRNLIGVLVLFRLTENIHISKLISTGNKYWMTYSPSSVTIHIKLYNFEMQLRLIFEGTPPLISWRSVLYT